MSAERPTGPEAPRGPAPTPRDLRDAMRGPQLDEDAGGPCAACGRPGNWVCGAGQYLCRHHEEDY